MMKKLYSVILIFSITTLTASLFGQEFLNQTRNEVNREGRRQGEWKVFDENGNLKFSGQFRDDIPFGEFIYYYPNGKTKAISNISGGGKVSYTRVFHDNGFLMAEGKYSDREKDSLWKYYSKWDENLLMADEFYEHNRKSGTWRNYYPTGEVAEEVTYVNDQKEGPWIQYFTEGTTKLKALYIHGALNGLITIYFPNGVVNISGTYAEGMKNSTWFFFNEKGESTKMEVYDEGLLISEEVFIEEPERVIEE